jgi:hypothetical protein
MGPLTEKIMLNALQSLDQKLTEASLKVSLIMGGGGAMILAHHFPKGTTDIDAIPKGQSPEVLDSFVKAVAKELGIEPDWLNPYFSTFAMTLPQDYSSRLIRVFDGIHLTVDALGKEEMLIMKCFAHRSKDIPHARALLKGGVKLELVENRLNELLKKKIPNTQKAIDFLQDLLDEMDGE